MRCAFLRGQHCACPLNRLTPHIRGRNVSRGYSPFTGRALTHRSRSRKVKSPKSAVVRGLRYQVAREARFRATIVVVLYALSKFCSSLFMRILGNPKITHRIATAVIANAIVAVSHTRYFRFSPGYPLPTRHAHSPFATAQSALVEERGHSTRALSYLAQTRLGEMDTNLISEFAKNRLV